MNKIITISRQFGSGGRTKKSLSLFPLWKQLFLEKTYCPFSYPALKTSE